MARQETGPVRFGKSDWPGVFIRGDRAMYYAMQLRLALQRARKGAELDAMTEAELNGLAELLASCREPVDCPVVSLTTGTLDAER